MDCIKTLSKFAAEWASWTYLGHLKFDPAYTLPISNGKVGREWRVSNDRGTSISVLMRQPLTVPFDFKSDTTK